MRRVALAALAFALLPAAAQANIPATLHDPANCPSSEPAPGFAVFDCDDGVPTTGGANANEGGVDAITVPAVYDGYKGLPRRSEDAAGASGADSAGNVALDVDVTLPSYKAKGRGFPLLFLMHGCCAGSKTGWQGDVFDEPGERWHYNDAWFAARGYVVVTYTARGFVNGSGEGSTGNTELDSRSYEINDYQSLACQVSRSAQKGLFDDVTGKKVRIDPKRVVTTGGSYGGGFSWMALTDPKWKCPGELGTGKRKMSLKTVAPKYGWTDLLYSLVPTGTHFQSPGSLPSFDGCDSGPLKPSGEECADGSPIGIPKKTITAALYASGETGVPPGSSHTTFPAKIGDAIQCLEGTYPPAPASPLCADTVSETLPEFLRERSAYYQSRFFKKIKRKRSWRVPVFSAATFTDPLFTPVEHTRMANRLRSVVPNYPIKTYHGDYQHFVQNKAKEWGDVCVTGSDRHVCTVDEFTNGFNAAPPNRELTGVTTLLNNFIDRYAKPRRNRRAPKQKFDVTAALQVCPENAGDQPTDEPGRRYRAKSFAALTHGFVELTDTNSQTMTSAALPNLHAIDADPVLNQVQNGSRCAVDSSPAGPGVATYNTGPLTSKRTVIGPTRITADFSVTPSTAEGVQINARVYDVAPDGTAVLVDRGPRIVSPAEIAAGTLAFETHGNGWNFEQGHGIRVELAQDDDPYLHRTDSPTGLSSITLSSVTLRFPTVEP